MKLGFGFSAFFDARKRFITSRRVLRFWSANFGWGDIRGDFKNVGKKHNYLGEEHSSWGS